MHEERLITYINDHLAGAVVAIEILERLINENGSEPLGHFAKDLLKRIESDEDEVKGLLKRLNGMPGVFKNVVAWTGAKISAPKVGGSETGDFGNFQALELLSIGILGKRALWIMLEEMQPLDSRLTALNYSRLINRAETQFNRSNSGGCRL